MYGDYEIELKKKMSFNDLYQIFIPVEVGVLIKSPFRDRLGSSGRDSSPSLMIKEFNGNLYWTDFGSLNQSGGDGLDFAAKMMNTDRSNAAKRLLKANLDYVPYVPHHFVPSKNIETHTLTDFEISYWGTLGITSNLLLKERVLGLTSFQVGNYLIWESTIDSPKFKYYVDENSYQLYAPKEPKGRRHRSHQMKDKIFGYHSLPLTHKGLLVTKSYKDLLVWKTLGAKAVISPGSETSYQSLLSRFDELESRFGKVYVGFDDDERGRESEEALCRETNWKSLKLKFPDNSKDPSGVIEKFGILEGYKILKQWKY